MAEEADESAPFAAVLVNHGDYSQRTGMEMEHWFVWPFV